ncbi:MAG: chloride channel protein [Actinomycetota bacterium]|nr:chloride channel protein [Actinomycetota bacterium]
MADQGRRDRAREPSPVFKNRLPHGRGATEQPNATGIHDKRLTPRFWLLLLLTSAVAGTLGSLLMKLLFFVMDLAYGYKGGNLDSYLKLTSPTHRIIALLIAGAIGGPGFYLIKKKLKGGATDADDLLWRKRGQLSTSKSTASSILQEIVIGLGASIGREAAPKLMGAVAGDFISRTFKVTEDQRWLLIACGAGAGLASVYNVPLAGAIFIVEVLLAEINISVALPALASTSIATLTSYIFLPEKPAYPNVRDFHLHGAEIAFAIVAAPIVAVFATFFVRIIGLVSHHKAKGKLVLFAPLVVMGLQGILGIWFYQLFGNGKDMAQNLLGGEMTSLPLLATLFILKPILTALVLESGLSGGILTPLFSSGALLGGFLGGIWLHFFHSGSIEAYAMLGASAALGAGLQAPITGLVLILELTHTGLQITVPIILITFLATAISRRLDGYSIYSARLPEVAE